MEKAKYNIAYAIKNRGYNMNLGAIPGYIFYYSGIRFGVSKYYLYAETPTEGFTWRVTELTTGFAVGAEGRTAKAAIENLIASKRIYQIRKAVEAWPKADANPGLTPKNEYLSVH